LLADDSKQKIHQRMGSLTHVVADVAAPWEALAHALQAMPSVADHKIKDLGRGFLECMLTSSDGVDLRPLLFEEVKRRGWTLRELTHRQPNLEDLFVQLTRSGHGPPDD
jgi:hypothetical protein